MRKVTYSKLRFSKFKKFAFRSVFGKLQPTQISLNLQTSCSNLKIRGLRVKLWVWLFHYFYFERNYDVLKSTSPCILLNKSINFNENETESKIPLTVLERWTMCFSSYKNWELKAILWWAGAQERKMGAFFVTFVFNEKNFLT